MESAHSGIRAPPRVNDSHDKAGWFRLPPTTVIQCGTRTVGCGRVERERTGGIVHGSAVIDHGPTTIIAIQNGQVAELIHRPIES